MKQFRSTVVSLKKCSADYFELTAGWEGEAPRAGQFATIRVAEYIPLLRKPFAFSASTPRSVSFLIQKRGKGTEILSRLKEGDTIDLLGPLGNGFPLSDFRQKTPDIIAGGIGIGPMLFLADQLQNQRARFIVGCRNKNFIPHNLLTGIPHLNICTDDGSEGFHGSVIDFLKRHPSPENAPLAACGPHPMLRACHTYAQAQNTTAWVSLEAMMACGVGACQGCVVEQSEPGTYTRVCKDGPVYDSKEIRWI